MDVARGLDKMHSRHIIHLDLKSPNILLTAGGTAKIAVRLLLRTVGLPYGVPPAYLCFSSFSYLEVIWRRSGP
jgi:serine/threonine protein kinase